MYKGEADWTLIAKVKENPRIHIPIFGNGDIDSPEKALEYRNRYGVDGIMIGRASIGYPWIFNEIKHYFKTGEKLAPPTIQQRAEACRKHFEFSLRWKGSVLGVLEMRRHYANYFKGLPHFKEDRTALVTLKEPEEILAKLNEIVRKYDGIEFALS
jgi:tRNA-dihydrouridine synthase